MSASITKDSFIRYLTDPDADYDQPFCKEGRCPLAQYFYDTHNLEYKVTLTNHYMPGEGSLPEITNRQNPEWMTVFIANIDAVDLNLNPFHRPSWEKLTPKQCLEVLK